MPITDMDSIKPLYDAITVHRNNYNSGETDYSVTTLLDPPRIVHLQKRHMHKVDMFVKEQLGSYIGTAIHEYSEKCLNQVRNPAYYYEQEERLFLKILDRNVSGCYDLVRIEDMDMDMYDWKTTSVWKAMFSDKKDWTAQQNMYRYLYWLKKKKTLRTVRIIAIYLDWSMREKQQYGAKYPNEKSIEYGLPRWSMQKTYDYTEGRVQLMIDNEETPDDDLPSCSFDEMWSKPDKVAVVAKKRKNALRVLDSKKEATDWMGVCLGKDKCKYKADQLSLEFRPAVRTRCEHWCSVNMYCNQFHSYLKDMATYNKMKGDK
jgi:hypothetical protein